MNIIQRLYKKAFGKRITSPKAIKPTKKERAASANLIKLSSEKLGTLLRMSESGDMPATYRLFHEMERIDPYLRSFVYKRKLAAVEKDIVVEPAAKDKKSKDIATFVENLLSFKDFRNSLMDQLDSISKGFSISEIFWEINNGQVSIDTIKHIDSDKLDFYNEDGTVVVDLEDINYVNDNGSRIKLRPRNRFFISKNSTLPIKNGANREITFWYVIKNYPQDDWTQFSKSFSKVFNKLTSNLLSNNNSSLLADLAHDTYEKLILGPKRHDNSENHIVTELDCLNLAEDLFYQIVVPAIVWQYGPQENYPKISFKVN